MSAAPERARGRRGPEGPERARGGRGQPWRRQNSSKASRRRLGQNRSRSSRDDDTPKSYTAPVWRCHPPVAEVPSRVSPYRGAVIRSAALEEMSPRDLYDVLALRVAVFVAEQGCAYAELDGRDLEPGAVHWWSRDDDGGLTGYLRVLVEPGGGHRIGRVVTTPAARGTGVGAALMRAALTTLPGPVVLGAQVRARGFYARHGFVVDGPEYDEDGIPHIPMFRGSTGAVQEAGGSWTMC